MLKRENCAALILAGGAGTRLGEGSPNGEKWAVKLQDKTLLDHVLEQIRDQTETHFLCVAPATGLPPHLPEHQRINDPTENRRGPLPALFAGLRQLAQTPFQYALGVAVDTPFFPVDFIDRASDIDTHPNQPIVGCWGKQAYPTCALWPVALLTRLEKHLAQHASGSLFGFLDQTGYHRLDYQAHTSHNPFFNINTIDDLKFAKNGYTTG